MGPADPTVAGAAVAATALEGPLRVVFDWRMRERDARYNGQGVARVEPPDRARLDLFGPRGEGLLSAAVVGQAVRLPEAAQTVPMPPPALLWGTLGVVAPPPGATLDGTQQDGQRVRLAYTLPDGRLLYELEAGRLRGMRLEGPNRRMTVELEGDAGHGAPRRAVYRDWSAFVELEMDVDRVEDVDPYPDDVWVPGR